LSCESGAPTIHETARRIARVKGFELRQAAVCFSFDLPQLSDPAWLAAICRWIERRRLAHVIVDPAYLVLLDQYTAQQAGNMFAMGRALRAFAEVIQRTGATPYLVHHANRTAARLTAQTGEPLELTDIAFAGFDQFARQWMLINRRQKYEVGSGAHKLWMNVGGSAGHGRLLAVDIDEGRSDDEPIDAPQPAPRRQRLWCVRVMTPTEAAERDRLVRDERRSAERTTKETYARDAICKFLGTVRECGATKKQIAVAVRAANQTIGNDRLAELLDWMVATGELSDCDVRRHTRKERGYRLSIYGDALPSGE
jgi:hypothetical protein